VSKVSGNEHWENFKELSFVISHWSLVEPESAVIGEVGRRGKGRKNV
jgi:hypothetical protein